MTYGDAGHVDSLVMEVSVVPTHITITHKDTNLTYRGSTTDRDTFYKQVYKLHKLSQKDKCHPVCEDVDIDNVWVFKYLGSWIRIDGDQLCDVDTRITTLQQYKQHRGK